MNQRHRPGVGAPLIPVGPQRGGRATPGSFRDLLKGILSNHDNWQGSCKCMDPGKEAGESTPPSALARCPRATPLPPGVSSRPRLREARS